MCRSPIARLYLCLQILKRFEGAEVDIVVRIKHLKKLKRPQTPARRLFTF
jgi:hypothetical protein